MVHPPKKLNITCPKPTWQWNKHNNLETMYIYSVYPIYKWRFSITMLVFRGVEHDGFFPAKGGTKPCFKKTAEFTHWLQSQASGDSRDDVTTHPCVQWTAGWFTSKSLPIEIRKINENHLNQTRWWLSFNKFWKICQSQIGNHFPYFWGENKKCLKPPPGKSPWLLASKCLNFPKGFTTDQPRIFCIGIMPTFLFQKNTTILHSHSLQQTGCFEDGFRYLISLSPLRKLPWQAGKSIGFVHRKYIFIHG